MKPFNVLILLLILFLTGCSTLSSLKQEAGYGITPSQLCEVQKPWQATATDTNLAKAAVVEQSTVVSVRMLPEWATQNYIGFSDDKGKHISVRLVAEAVYFPKTGGFEVYHGYPTEDMKFLNVVAPNTLKDHFVGGSWLLPSGSYRSAMTANGAASKIVALNLTKEGGCFASFKNVEFFKSNPSQNVSIHDTATDGDMVKFVLRALAAQFAQNFTVEGETYYSASKEGTVAAAGVTNQATGLDYAIGNQSVPISPLSFMNPISAGFAAIPVALFLDKVFDEQHSLRGSVPEAGFTREEASEFFGKVLGKNQDISDRALAEMRAVQQENRALKARLQAQ